MSEDIEDLVFKARDIIDRYNNINGDDAGYMAVHDMSRDLHAKIMALSVRLMEIDQMFTDKKIEHIKNVAREKERLLETGIYTAHNRAESKAETSYIELKGEVIMYERIYGRLKLFIQNAGEVAKDMRSYISSLKKEREYEQTGGHT